MLAPVHLTRLWIAALAALLLGVSAAAVYAGYDPGSDYAGVAPSPSAPTGLPAPAASDPALETFLPQDNRAIPAGEAVAENFASPLARVNPPAPPFSASWLAPADFDKAATCLASALFYEADGEPPAGQLAVAQVILNRLRHPRFPKTVCGVVYQGSERASGCQFTFTCDGSLARAPSPAGLARARAVAEAALSGAISPAAGQATHYHTIWVVPVWAHEMAKVAIIGHHVFYRPPALYGGYPPALAMRAPLAPESPAAAPPATAPPLALTPAPPGADTPPLAPPLAAAPPAAPVPPAPPAAATPPARAAGWFAAAPRRPRALAIPSE